VPGSREAPDVHPAFTDACRRGEVAARPEADARIIDEMHAHPDDEIYVAMRTAMLKVPSSTTIVISSARQGTDSPLGGCVPAPLLSRTSSATAPSPTARSSRPGCVSQTTRRFVNTRPTRPARHSRRVWRIDSPGRNVNVEGIIALWMALDAAAYCRRCGKTTARGYGSEHQRRARQGHRAAAVVLRLRSDYRSNRWSRYSRSPPATLRSDRLACSAEAATADEERGQRCART
jgi:hypothetical protein